MPRARKQKIVVEDIEDEDIEDEEDEEEEAPKPKRRGRGRPAKKAAAKPATRGRKKKPPVVEEEDDEDYEDEEEEEAPKPKKGRGKAKAKPKAKPKAEKREYAEVGAVWDDLDDPMTTRVSYDPEECNTLRSGTSKQGILLEYMTTGPRKKRGASVKQLIAHFEDVNDGAYEGKAESMIKWWIDNGYLAVDE
jgi:hypothetical protein